MDLRVFQVDAFTTELFSGNPAGVVLNADRLSERQMLSIARELNNSETAFIINAPNPEYDIEVRFFTPTREVPICGHATIAAHYVYAKENGLKNCILTQKTKAGILPVEIQQTGGDLRIIMTQAGIEFGATFEGQERAELLRGLGLSAGDIDDSLPIQIVSTGHSKVMAPLRTKACLDSICIKGDVLSDLSERISCNGFYAFTFDSQEEQAFVSGRMFAPAIGINEDPVTGNANGPLGAYLTKYGRIEARESGFTFYAKQGEAINRKGYVGVHVFSKGREPSLIKISGRAVVAFATTITV
jgi:PhzF family phenazine biosynthesis protein